MNQADWLRKRLRSARKLGCAPEIGALLLLTLGLLFGVRAAWAVEGDGMTGGPASQKTLGDYLADLGGDDDAERLFAARTVRLEVRTALRRIAHAPADSLAALDAQSVLVEIDARAPVACTTGLTHANSAAFCAEILADLGHREMIPRIAEAREIVANAAARRRIDVALAKLIDAGQDTTAAPPAMGSTPPP